MMRELQKQRQRARGVTLEAKGMMDEVEEALASAPVDTTQDHSLDATFTSQADSGEVDPNMLKYIEEQMKGGGGAEDSGAEGGERRVGALDPEEAELYTTPAHLKGAILKQANVQEESANRWLAGIVEVPLGTEAKMASIEETERAKRAMMERHASKRRAAEDEGTRAEHKMSVPGNFNANFHQHRREFAMARKGQHGNGGRGGGGRGGGGRGGGGGSSGARDIAGDAAAYGRFRANERKHGR
jgi:hypothetical protein